MKQSTFANVTNNLNNLIRSCDEIAKAYNTGVLAQIKEFGEEARYAQGKLDKVFQSELYHLLGMGGLTLGQSTMLIKMIQKLGSYRPLIKTVATMSDGQQTIPKIKSSAYQSILTETVLRPTPDGSTSDDNQTNNQNKN